MRCDWTPEPNDVRTRSPRGRDVPKPSTRAKRSRRISTILKIYTLRRSGCDISAPMTQSRSPTRKPAWPGRLSSARGGEGVGEARSHGSGADRQDAGGSRRSPRQRGRWEVHWSRSCRAVALADRERRVVARIEDERITVLVVRVAHRREVYRQGSRRLPSCFTCAHFQTWVLSLSNKEDKLQPTPRDD